MRIHSPILASFSCSVALALSMSSWPQVTHAQAWTRLGETDQVALFVNRHSIERDGYIRKVWEMQDLKQADQDGVMSRRYLNEYDCQNKMYRISQMTSFEGPKLTGKKLFEISDVGYWRKIPPNGLFILGYVAHCVQ